MQLAVGIVLKGKIRCADNSLSMSCWLWSCVAARCMCVLYFALRTHACKHILVGQAQLRRSKTINEFNARHAKCAHTRRTNTHPQAAAFSGGGVLLAISRQQHHRTGLSTLRCQVISLHVMLALVSPIRNRYTARADPPLCVW